MSEKGGHAETSTAVAQAGQVLRSVLSGLKEPSLALRGRRFNASCLLFVFLFV